jgi:glycosyltransferase involved in cell wall biosynthesis
VGKPVVATNAGYVNFAIENNVNGILIEEGDVKGFSDAILKLASDREMRETYGTNGRKKAVNELTWYRNVDKFVQPLFRIQSN